jgi:hypothetical protein
MPTTKTGKPTLSPAFADNKFEIVSKHANEALEALIEFDNNGATACRISDLPEIKRRTKEYVIQCRDNANLPTITGLSARLGVTRNTVSLWMKDTNQPDTMQYLKFVKTVFADMLEQSALNGSVDKIFSMFLLKSTHDYQEVNKVVVEAKPNQYGEALTDEEIANLIEE